ncbi:hypothetical protein JHK84_047578 [Glycine max]|nr:hypothetical protein JHK84_047578 [Glycine max]
MKSSCSSLNDLDKPSSGTTSEDESRTLRTIKQSPGLTFRGSSLCWRARWKNKQLKHLYDSLKHEFNVISKEKQKLEEEWIGLDIRTKTSKQKQRAAAGELRLLGKRNADNRVCIAEAGAIPPLVDLLSSSDPRTQEHAVTTLLNLSINETYKTLSFEHPRLFQEQSRVFFDPQFQQQCRVFFDFSSIGGYVGSSERFLTVLK